MFSKLFEYLNKKLEFEIKKYNDSKVTPPKEKYLCVAVLSTTYTSNSLITHKKETVEFIIHLNESNNGNRTLMPYLKTDGLTSDLNLFTKDNCVRWVVAKEWEKGKLGLNEYQKFQIKTYEEAEKEFFLDKLSNVYK